MTDDDFPEGGYESTPTPNNPNAGKEDYDDPTEEQVAAFEEQLADLDEKDLLIGILAELKWLRVALTSGESAEETQVYECRTCNKTVPKDERERHLREQHNWPGGMDVAEEYDEVVE